MAEKKKKPVSTDSSKEEIKTPLKKIKVAKPKVAATVTKKEVKKVEEKTEAPKAKVAKSADLSTPLKTSFAVIRTGGKQYIVRAGEKHKFEKIEAEEGKTVKFDDVLLVKKGDKIEIGAPKVSGAVIEAKVVSQTKGDKIVVFKYKKRKNYRKKTGHRQKLTEVEIVKI